MKAFISFCMFLVFAAAAFADDLVSRQGGDSLRLTGAECPAAMTAQIPADMLDKFRAAVATLDKKEFRGCWIMTQELIYVIYDDGDTGGPMPFGMFKNEPGV